MREPNEITARDRIAAVQLAGEAEALAKEARWAAWVLLPLAKLLRWMAEEERDDDLYY